MLQSEELGRRQSAVQRRRDERRLRGGEIRRRVPRGIPRQPSHPGATAAPDPDQMVRQAVGGSRRLGEGQRTPAGEDELRSRALPRPVVQEIMKPHRTLEQMKPASAAILVYCARLAQHLDGRDCAQYRTDD